MDWFTGVVVFILVWWVVLFTVLPIGTRPDPDGALEEGGWRGAPRNPLLARKLVITTLIAIVIASGIFAIIHSDWLSFRTGWLSMQEN